MLEPDYVGETVRPHLPGDIFAPSAIAQFVSEAFFWIELDFIAGVSAWDTVVQCPVDRKPVGHLRVGRSYANEIREPHFAEFVRICRVLETTPNAMLGVADPPVDDPFARRAIAALEAMPLSLRPMAASILETMAAQLDEGIAQRPPEPSPTATRKRSTARRI